MIAFVVLVTWVTCLSTGILANKLIEKVNWVPFCGVGLLGEPGEYNVLTL